MINKRTINQFKAIIFLPFKVVYILIMKIITKLKKIKYHPLKLKFLSQYKKRVISLKYQLGIYPKNRYAKSKFQIVIARYNEDISWSNPLKENRIIYNKGPEIKGLNEKKLPNFGRESHTYLHHIVENYDKLADITLFCQGNIDEDSFLIEYLEKVNEWKGRQIIETVIRNEIPETDPLISMPFFQNGELCLDNYNRINFFGKWETEFKDNVIKDCKYDFKTWVEKYIFEGTKIDLNSFIWSPAGIFYVSKKLIYSNPKRYYERLLKTLDHHNNPVEGHYFERAWFYIFTHNYSHKIPFEINNTTKLSTR